MGLEIGGIACGPAAANRGPAWGWNWTHGIFAGEAGLMNIWADSMGVCFWDAAAWGVRGAHATRAGGKGARGGGWQHADGERRAQPFRETPLWGADARGGF